MAKVHSFEERRLWSRSMSGQLWFGETYRRAFGEGFTMQTIEDDGWAQRAGIDRMLVLPCGRSFGIDEKVREKEYGDVLLEFMSDKARKQPGWVVKPLLAEYIAYAVAPSGRCHLFPTLTLQRAWRHLGEGWKRRYGVIDVLNTSWVTLCVPVPTAVLFDAIRDAMNITMSPMDQPVVKEDLVPASAMRWLDARPGQQLSLLPPGDQ
jgi:hypothetical protein